MLRTTVLSALLCALGPNAHAGSLDPVTQKLPGGGEAKVVKCYPEGAMRGYCASFDDGTLGSDWPVLDALRQRNIPATFFLNSLHPQSKDAVAFPDRYAGFEVASHGANHHGFSKLEPVKARFEVEEDQKILGEKFQRTIDGFAYPYGDMPKTEEGRQALDQLLRELGIVYARGVMPTNAFAPPEDFIRWDPDCGFMHSLDKYLALPAEDSVRSMMCFTHSIDFARGRQPFEKWLETLDRIAADKTIWPATMSDFAHYVTALRGLHIEARGIHNPGKLAVWVKVNGKPFEIPAKTALTWKQLGP